MNLILRITKKPFKTDCMADGKVLFHQIAFAYLSQKNPSTEIEGFFSLLLSKYLNINYL